jgi:hypothetical protein
MYNPIYGQSKPPTEPEVRNHANSWWVQADHTYGYQSWHFHGIDSVLEFLRCLTGTSATHLVWRPYFRETGMLRTEWPVGEATVVLAVISTCHDGTGSI